MIRNTELLNRLADHFEAQPETWKQDSWGVANECGTHACIAGTAVIFTYGEAAFTPNFCGMPDCTDSGCADGDMHVRLRFGDDRTITDHAAGLLGLGGEAFDLFVSSWKPNPELGLPGALRALANGATVDEVSA